MREQIWDTPQFFEDQALKERNAYTSSMETYRGIMIKDALKVAFRKIGSNKEKAYIYQKHNLNDFLEQFAAKGGDLSSIGIEEIKNNLNETIGWSIKKLPVKRKKG